MSKARSIAIDYEAIKEAIRKSGKTQQEFASKCNMTYQRLSSSLQKRQTTKLGDNEIIELSIQLDMPIKKMLLPKQSAIVDRLTEAKRIEVNQRALNKDFIRFYNHADPKIISMKDRLSPAEIVKPCKRKYNPMKQPPIPPKPDDPNKVYKVDRLGVRCLIEEIRCGVRIRYIIK